jgi:tripartite-type tricarboxylate transporter receptor subunit TctC
VRINQALIASNGLAANNVRELIGLANKRPGEITYGTAGVGSAPHVNIVKFENMAHVKLQAIHYRGAAPALNDILAGHINLMSVSYSLVVQPFAEKKLKVLAVGGLKRSPQLPNSPTVDESGVPGYDANTWFGLAAPGGTPRDVVMKINAEVGKILADPAFQQRFMAPQMFESMASSPEEFSQYIKSEIPRWAKIIREQGVVIE